MANSERKTVQALQDNLRYFDEVVRTLEHAVLFSSGYHQHHRQWRKKRKFFIPTPNRGIDMEKTLSLDSLEDIVQRARDGDTEVLPVIRHAIAQVPELWQEGRLLASEVERAWLSTLCSSNLFEKELLTLEADSLREQLLQGSRSPLEKLLVDRIVSTWLAVQHAEKMATQRLGGKKMALSKAEELRLDKTHTRFLTAVKSLAQVRKLLRPGAAVQVNIAQQQVNMA